MKVGRTKTALRGHPGWFLLIIVKLMKHWKKSKKHPD